MGYYDQKWNNLPTNHNLHSLIPLVALFVHASLTIPIFIQKRKLEAQENAQNPLDDNIEHPQMKSLESFLVNCITMGSFIIGTLNAGLILNKYVILITNPHNICN